MRRWSLIIALVAAPAFADEPPPRIIVTGSATVTTPPDRAQIAFTVHGEGTTSDEAVQAMVGKRKAIESGLARFGRAEANASTVAINEVRAPSCNRAPYGQPRLASGDCVIVGYTADIQMILRIASVGDAGTIVGLIGRQGGTNPRLDHFFLSDDKDAQRRAGAAAITDARRQAEALAAGTGVKLGGVLSISNAGYGFQPFAQDIVVTGSALPPPPPPPPAPPPPPIAVDLHPKPMETQARVNIVYAIVR